MSAGSPLISVISPVYCCANCLRDLCTRIGAAVGTITQDYEIVLVDDASPDAAWAAINDLCARDVRIKGIALSRNFGQHYAIAAGLEQVTGEWIVVMDCDLQDRPEEIAQLYAKAKEGYDVVLAEREVRQDSWVKRTSSRLFIGMLNYLSGANYDYRTANFGIFHRRVVDAIRSMGDASRFFPVMVRWTGFRRTSIAVQHDARADGSSGYTWRKLIRLGLDIVLSNSDKPLRLVAVTGILIALIAVGITGYSLFRYLHGDVGVAGYTSIIASMWLLAGVILFCMGVIGLYIGRVFESVKFRPVFIVRERLNL